MVVRIRLDPAWQIFSICDTPTRTMIETIEDAEKLLDKKYQDDWPPITSDPKVNYLIDQAMAIGPEEDWEDVKDDYENEVEHLTQSDEVVMIGPEEL